LSSKREQLLKAKTTLGIGSSATLAQIKAKYKALMKVWHPDLNPDNLEKAQQMSAHIIESYKTVMEYCNNYEYDFSEEKLDNYLSPQEWWEKRFKQ
jgi:DnaJ-class molecular chaperone